MAYYPTRVRPYLVLYAGVRRDDMRGFIDAMADVSYWYAALPSSFFITTTAQPTEMTDRFMKKFGENASFFITPLSIESVNGYLPEQVWHMIQNPESPFEDSR